MAQHDQLGRPLRTLRISVTDRCNLRCEYCMPEEDYAWLPQDGFLTLDELDRLVNVFASLGVSRIRLTGGEPLLRPDLPEIIRRLSRKSAVEDLALTTNGVLLAPIADELRRAGLRRLTVSLDTVDSARFRALSRRNTHEQVLEGIHAASKAGFDQLKIDAVILRGSNEDGRRSARLRPELRCGGPVHRIHGRRGRDTLEADAALSRTEMLTRIRAGHGPVTGAEKDPHAPADRYLLKDGTTFGIIASTTAPFCATCDRSRLTADGVWFLCLYAPTGVSLRDPLRRGATDAELSELIAGAWSNRRDRGAEDRLGLPDRGSLVPLEALRRDPHREMHTRGG